MMKNVNENELELDVNGSKIICEQYGDIKNAKKIVLFCHGFPGSNRLDRLWDHLKNESVLVIEMNYRGDKKSEGIFSFLGSMEDIKTAANYLKRNYNLPLYALGISMGGLYISNIISQEPELFNKVILLNPVVDSMALFSDKCLMDELWEVANNLLELKTPKDYEEEVKMVTSKYNPMGLAKKIENNITIIQSTADEVTDPEFVKRFYSLLDCEKSYYDVLNGKHDLKGDEKELINRVKLVLIN